MEAPLLSYVRQSNQDSSHRLTHIQTDMNTHITEEEAHLLPNKTAPEAPYEGSGYLVVLNVFHDLHCIDSIRRSLYYFLNEQWNSTYNPYTLYDNPDDALWTMGGDDMSIMHLDHCIDALRQSAQCNVDITPHVFQFNPKLGEIRARATVVHECRNFDKVRVHTRKPRGDLVTADSLFQGRRMGKAPLLSIAVRRLWRWPRSWKMWD